MLKAPIPKNEKFRLKSLQKLKILDTAPEDRFDRITNLASRLFDVPIATLTLVDSNREWFKSVCGLNKRESDRAISFCGHAMLAEDIFIIPDATKDPRFADNPMVIGKPFIRFYAGVPIFSSDGHRMGTFCIKDRKPRVFSKKDQELLKALASWSQTELNYHDLAKALETAKELEKERKALIEQKAQKKQLAQQYHFTSVISHQLRTPVSNALAALEVMLQNREFVELGVVYKKIKSLNDIIGTLLFYVEHRNKLHASDYELDAVDLAAIIRSQLELLNDLKKIKKIKITEDVPKKMMVFGNKLILNRVIYTLIHNAITYNKENGKVAIKLKADDKAVILEIEDDGYGIPKNEQSSVFSEYFRASNSSLGANQGSGLSLYIAYNLLKSMGTDLSFESKENKKTLFSVKFKKYAKTK